MPRIPDEIIERVKLEVSVAELARRMGVKLRKVGEELVGCCPFPPHEDTTPSLSINPSRNVWQCFGCGIGGTSIDWTMKEKALEFRAAVELLLREFLPSVAGDVLGQGQAQTRRSRAPELPCPFELDADDQSLLNQYADFCHALFLEHAEPQDYVRKRGLDSSELVSHFKLGYQDRTLGLRLPTADTKTGRETRERFQKLGLIRESGHGHLVGSLVIAIRDENDNVQNLYGRKTVPNLRKGTPDHLYLPGPHRGVFNVEALRASTEIILCESLIDALTFWRWGFRNVTTSYGTNGFTEEIFEAMKASGTEKVFIAYDRDEAGDAGAHNVALKLMGWGIDCFRVLFPKGMDANDVALKMTPADKTLGLFLRSAEWMGNGHRPPRGDAPTVHAPAPRAHEAPPSAVSTARANEPASSAAEAASSPAEATEESVGERAADKGNGSEPSASGLVSATENEALFAFEDRKYRVRDLKKGLSYGSLRVNIRAERQGDYFAPPSPIAGWFLDTVDLCLHRQRALFEKQAAHELGLKEEVIRFDLGKVVKALEDLQEKRITEALEPKVKVPTMTEAEHADALALAKDPNLIERIVEAFEKAGIVGERINALVLYLAAISRKLDRPLAVVIRSSSAAGKTALMDAVLSFVPDEEQERYSALTENVLFYFEGKDFKHKVLAIAEEQGAERASYPLKLLQSEGELVMASTGKDPQTGRLDAKEYRVEGPLMILLSSTAAEMDEEFLNRCLVLTVDESREQTKRIHELQREAETLEGYLRKSERTKLTRLHQNFQRLLRPLPVFNPFSRELTFLDDQTRTRRDHPKYLTLIRSIALLHQHQREKKTCVNADGATIEYIEVTREDITLANRLASEVLGHSLSELQPQTRKLLVLLDAWVSLECEKSGVDRQDFLFTRRQARDALRWGDTQLRIHLARLHELEYLLLHRGGRGQSFVFELLYEGQGLAGERFLLGLFEPTTTDTSRGVDATSRGWEADLAGVKRPQSGAFAGGSRGDETSLPPNGDRPSRDSERENAENAQLPPREKTASYLRSRRTHVNGHALLRFNLLRFPPPSGNGKPPRRSLELEAAVP